MTVKQAHSLGTPRISAADLNPMRALSLWQPWASLCFTFLKRHETRHWATDYRGPLAIHAAQKLVTDLDRDLLDLLCDEFGGHWARDLPRGRMLGIVDLTDCKPTEALAVDAIDRLCGNFEPGRFAWRLDNPRLFEDPPEVKGRQGFFTWPVPVWAETKGTLL